jgi:hypothetical protein
MFECAHVTFLDYVFRFIVVSDNAPHDSENTLVVPSHQDFERRRIAGKNSTHDFYVGQRSGRIVRATLFANRGIKLLNHNSLRSLPCGCMCDGPNFHLDIRPTGILRPLHL